MTAYPVTVAEGIGTAPTDATVRRTFVDYWDFFEYFYIQQTDRPYIPQERMTQGIGINYGNVIAARARQVTSTEGIGAHDVPTALRGVVMLEHLGIALAQTPNSRFHLVNSEAMGVAARLNTGVGATLTSGVGITPTQQVRASLRLIEKLGLAGVVVPALTYHLTSTEQIRVASELVKFLGGFLTEAVGVHDALLSPAAKGAQLAEGIGIAPSQTPRLVLRVTATSGIGLHDVNILRAILTGTLNQGIQITAAYLSPGSSGVVGDSGITTWAMNTRTGSVTEYDNYAFNSFARIGDKYLGATSAGLYELLGDDDNGTSIVARIKSGFAQWAGTHFTLFKAAYLGVRGEGDFVLRLITGDGKTYDYAVSTRDMRSTKVHMGKGLRARYFAFELISTGQDFDLDTIEFVPLVADRRV